MNTRKQEEGAVLIVALLLLLVTTFIGFAAMEGSSLGAKMATAREIKEQTFQTAEASIEGTLDNIVVFGQSYTRSLMDTDAEDWPGWPNLVYSYDYNEELDSSAEVRFDSAAQTIGYSIRKGASGVATYYYEVEATAERANTNIYSTHTQGVYIEGPSLN
jgi:hypothetical protein